jgi:hypothetical protein
MTKKSFYLSHEEPGWGAHQPCVVCAEPIGQHMADACALVHIAGACENHFREVSVETNYNYPAWPNHWFGNWWLTSGNGWYTSVDTEKITQWRYENGEE